MAAMAAKLPLEPPIKPQLARSRKTLPEGEGQAFEPKYDGFRAIVFVDGDESYVQSRGGKPLSRYFPELEFPAGRYVVDGELVILGDDGREVFDLLQARIHPAESRVKLLAERDPGPLSRLRSAGARRSRSCSERPFSERRAQLVEPDQGPRRGGRGGSRGLDRRHRSSSRR